MTIERSTKKTSKKPTRGGASPAKANAKKAAPRAPSPSAAAKTALPAFLPPMLPESKPTFAWKGELAHIGPTHTANPLFKKLAGTASGGNTHCAILALEAGVLQWGAFAFGKIRDVGAHADLAELLFLAMDPSFTKDVDWTALNAVTVPARPKEDAALGVLFRLARACLSPARWLDTGASPVRELFHSVYLVRHVLTPPMRKHFDRWLDDATRRIPIRAATKGFAPRTLNVTRDRTWGHPLPMSILDADCKPSELAKEREDLGSAPNRFVARVPTYFAKLTATEKAALKRLGVTRLADLTKVSLDAVGTDDAIGWNVAAILATELGAAGLAFSENEG